MQTMAAVVLVVMVIVLKTGGGAAGPVYPQHTSSPVQSQTLPGEAKQLRRWKRAPIVDSSCKGQYSRYIWNELYFVCEDCTNVFRRDGFEAQCRYV